MVVDQEEYETTVSSMVEAAELARVHRDELLGRVWVFTRWEPRLQAGKYVDCLLRDTPARMAGPWSDLRKWPLFNVDHVLCR